MYESKITLQWPKKKIHRTKFSATVKAFNLKNRATERTVTSDIKMRTRHRGVHEGYHWWREGGEEEIFRTFKCDFVFMLYNATSVSPLRTPHTPQPPHYSTVSNVLLI